jgi:hypothetical protein
LAKRSFTTAGLTWAPSALNAQATTSNYMSILGITATQVIDIDEVLISGTASASTIGAFAVVPQGTLGTGGATALAAPATDGAMQSNATPVIQTTAIAYTTNQVIPTNSTASPRINLGLNTFGGIIRWNAAPTQQMTMIGNAVYAAGPPVTFGAVVLFNMTAGTGASTTANAHIIYEPY